MPLMFFPPQENVSTTQVYGVADVPKGVVAERAAKIRRYGGDPMRYARNGTLFDDAIFKTEAVPMSALTEVFGLRAEGSFDGDEIPDVLLGVQVTLDGGSTYLVWDGAQWTDAGGSFNTVPEFNENCAALSPQNPKSLGFKIKISSQDDKTPTLSGLGAYIEFDYDPYIDFQKSVKGAFDEKFAVPVLRTKKLSEAAASVAVSSVYTAQEPIKVFNLTDDPHRNSDIFDSFVGGTVNFTAEQAVGSWLEFHFHGVADLFLCRQDETLHTTELPHTLVRTDFAKVPGRSVGYVLDRKDGSSTKKVRRRVFPVAIQAEMRIGHYTQNEREAETALRACKEVFRGGVRSLATGQQFVVIEEDEGDTEGNAAESLYYSNWRVTLRGMAHDPQYTEYDALKEVRVELGNADEPWPSDDVTVEESS